MVSMQEDSQRLYTNALVRNIRKQIGPFNFDSSLNGNRNSLSDRTKNRQDADRNLIDEKILELRPESIMDN